MRTLDDILDVFSLGDLQTFKVIVQTLTMEGYTIEDAFDAIDEFTKFKRTTPLKVCIECGLHMRLYMVNGSDPTVQVGGDFQTQWLCSCGHDVFSTLTIAEEMNKIIVERENERVSEQLQRWPAQGSQK